MAEAAAPPVADPKKAANEQRLANLRKAQEKNKETKAAKAASGDTSETPKKVKTPATLRSCRCGCSGQTKGFFVPGHDARFKGWLTKIERGEKEISSLPESVQKAYEWKARGKGSIPTTNYKGEPHSGYLPLEEVQEA